MIDYKLAASIGIQNVKSWLPNGKQHGPEWVSLNPKRPGDTRLGSFSINLETGIWSDFADQNASGGDAVSLYAYLFDLTQSEAAIRILKDAGIDIETKPVNSTQSTQYKAASGEHKSNSKRKYDTIYPVPPGAGTPPLKHRTYGEPSMTWTYRDANGNVLFYICRYDKEGERKQFTPWSYTTEGWRCIGHDEPRPLYNLDLLAQNRDKDVLIVEGEKCAQCASDVLSEFVVTTWCNGTNSVNKTDFSPLKGRRVWIWGDNDAPGREAVKEISKKLANVAAEISIVKPLHDKPKGWDIADAILIDKIEENRLNEIIRAVNKDDFFSKDESHLPYTPLGYDHGTLYFLSSITNEVITVTPSAMSKKTVLFSLAPLDYWEQEYAGRSGINVDLVCNELIQQCQKVGPYDPYRLRGRGAWFDKGRVVLHLGDRLIVDGAQVGTDEIPSHFIYESRAHVGNANATPLTANESKEIVDMMKMLSFTNLASHQFLAGWCMIATICGALDWRPHIWVTGPAGSGKSWVMENMIIPLLGDSKVHALGKSSEAGIRQMLNGDALPVVIDEAESDEKSQKDAMQAILTLMRQSSSESGASIYKGSITGKSVQYCIRSCFLLSSIGVGTKNHADETRVTPLNLRPDRSPNATARFEWLIKRVNALLSPEYCERLRARAIKMIPVIRKNKTILSRYISSHMINSTRMADQYGSLLAGTYALLSDDVLNEDTIVDFVKILETREDDSDVIEVADHTECLQVIMQSPTQLRSSPPNYFVYDCTIGELIGIQSCNAKNPGITLDEVDRHLRSMGIRYKDDTRMVHFALKHTGLQKILRDTPWCDNYSDMLRRIDGAQVDKVKTTYGAGINCRGTKIPVDVLFPEQLVLS